MINASPQSQIVVLVVEDDKFLRMLLSEKLKSERIFVVEAENGEEAMVKMKSEPRPHLILLDLLLPIMDGFEVLGNMKKDAELKNIPVVVLSNLNEEEGIRRAKELGAKDYMVKAYFTMDEIMEKIRRIIREEYV